MPGMASAAPAPALGRTTHGSHLLRVTLWMESTPVGARLGGGTARSGALYLGYYYPEALRELVLS